MGFNSYYRQLLDVFTCLLVTLFFVGSSCKADLYVSAAGANSVMRFDESTGAFLGNFVTPGSGGLGNPQGITFGPDGNLYVSSQASNNVLRYNGQTGAFIDVFASAAGTTFPAEINFRGGFLYMSDFNNPNGAVYRFNASNGALVDKFANGAILADGQSWDNAGDLYVSAGTRVLKYDGTTGASLGSFVNGGLGLALDNLFLPDGTLLVSDFSTNRVQRYSATGVLMGTAISGLAGPQGLEIGPDGQLYAGSFFAGTINRYDINTFALLGTFAVAPGSTTNNFVFHSMNVVPEPATAGLFGFGLLSCLFCRRSRKPGERVIRSSAR